MGICSLQAILASLEYLEVVTDIFFDSPLGQEGDQVVSGFLDDYSEGDGFLATGVPGVAHFLGAFPGDGAICAIPDLEKYPDIRLLGLQQSKPEKIEACL